MAALWLALAIWRTATPACPAVRGPAVLRLAQPRRGGPRHRPEARPHEVPGWRRPGLLALAAGACVAAVGRLIRFTPTRPPVAHATLRQPGRYLGVFEPGSPPNYDLDSELRPDGRQAAEPSGVLQRLGAAVRHLVREHDPKAWHHPVRPDRSYRPNSIAESASGTMMTTCVVRRECQPLGHAEGDRLRVRDERPLVFVGTGTSHPRTFVAAWRHIVGVAVRAQRRQMAADARRRISRVPGRSPPGGPGAQYVTWVGIDGYYYRSSDSFASVFGQTIAQVRAFTSKPVLLSETRSGQTPASS